jgi:hypothetical protein
MTRPAGVYEYRPPADAVGLQSIPIHEGTTHCVDDDAIQVRHPVEGCGREVVFTRIPVEGGSKYVPVFVIMLMRPM